MADYSEAADNALNALTTSSDGLIEEYEIRKDGRRVKRGKLSDQMELINKMQGMAARQSKGIFSLAKPKNPR